MTLYNIKSTSSGYRITKFDNDLNPESSYLVSLSECECPQGSRPTCRHRKMLPGFIDKWRVDTNWFYDYERQSWQQFGEPEPALTPQAGVPAPTTSPTCDCFSIDECDERAGCQVKVTQPVPDSASSPTSTIEPMRRRL